LRHTGASVWFVFVFVGLALLVASGLYLMRRLGDALAYLGVGPRARRWARIAIAWLLFGYPLLMVFTVVFALVAGHQTLTTYDGPIGSWLIVYPFFVAAIVLLQSLPWCAVIEVVHLVLRKRRTAAVARRFRALATLIVVGGFLLYTPIRIVVERDALRVRHHQLGDPRAGEPRFRIAFLADLQRDAHTGAERTAQVAAQVNAAEPDLILYGGDWINTGPTHITAAAEGAATLTSRLGTFSVRGDHEYFAYLDRHRSLREVEQALTARGVTMVANQVRWFEHDGRRIGVAFLEHNYIAKIPTATIDALIAELATADYSILVTHQLDPRISARARGTVDLVLAGHTHGGQVNPVIGLIHVSLARLETPYVDGRYRIGDADVIVTPGVGYSVVPFRYAAPPAIEILDITLPPPR
jgi:predicted MPP superfamily phosphohydrolase